MNAMDNATVVAGGLSGAKLVVRQGVQEGRSFPLGRQPVVLGREESADVALQDPEMSRRHARVSWHEGSYVLEDLRSTNGTSLNGVVIRAPQQLSHGDRISVGQTVLEFEWATLPLAQQPAYQETPYAAPPPPPPSPAPPVRQPAYQEVPYVPPPMARPAPPPPSPMSPPQPLPPPVAAVEDAPKPGQSRCLLFGCGCLILLFLVALGGFVAAMYMVPDQLKPVQDFLDQYKIPIQLTTMAYFSSVFV
jgi:hypothetical protein